MMNEQVERTGRFLFDNPWCSRKVIEALTGLDRAGQKLLEDGVYFERVHIPRANAQGHQLVYALTQAGQRAFTGRYRSPAAMSEALLMQSGRLDRARQGLVQLSQAGMLGWAISPWKFRRSGLYFDALFVLRIGNNQAMLAALAAPLPYVGIEWYHNLLEAWRRFRKKCTSIPALLILWNPLLEERAIDFLGWHAPTEMGSRVMVYWGDDLAGDGERRLLGLPGVASSLEWTRLPTACESQISQEAFQFGSRKTPYRDGALIQAWAGKSEHPTAKILGNFLSLKKGDLELLETIARFPGLSLKLHKYLDPRPRSQRKQALRLDRLLAAGLVVKTEALGDGCLTADAGLTLLAGLYGMSAEGVNRYMGWPVRANQFKEQKEHMRSVSKFMLKLHRERALVSWNYLSARIRFLVVIPGEPKPHRMVIWPDSIGLVRLSSKLGASFWLEVDRGTRRGDRLDAKLEKYFLAHAALSITRRIPVIVYLVDTGGEKDESRLKRVSRRFESIGRRYPGSPLTVLLATAQLIAQANVCLLEALLWRCYWKNTWNPELISLRTGLTGKG